jgi:hypothetical protein
VHVYSLNGGYEGESWTAHDLTIQSGTTGQATVHLAAGKVYEFKISSNCGKWYGNAWYTLNDISNWEFTDGAGNMKILTGPEGDYTFTVDVANGQASPAKVSVSVAYPSVLHPNAGYVYITKWWDHCYVHYWNNSDVAITEWNSDAEVTTYTTICGNNYYYMPALVDYHKLIIKDAAGDAGNSTGEQVTDAHGGKYITHDGSSWGWHDFTTHTITYAANGGGGSMSATSGICPDADQAITSNAFTAPTGCASFAHWTANVNVKVGGATVTAGNPIANGATIEDINSNITLTAVWKLATPTITDNGDNTFSISGSMAGSSYYYTTNNSTPTTSSSLYSSAVDFSAGEANITAKAIAHKDGYVDSDVASQACTYHAPDPCSEPTEVANEIARFFVPCGTSTAAAWNTTADASTGDNSFTTSGFGGTGNNWYTNATSGLIYGKFQSSTYIIIKLKSGSFQAGDVVTAYFNLNSGTKTGLKLKDKDSGNSFEPTASASDVETSGTYTLKAADIENDGSIKFFRTNSSTYVNRIIVTRPACTNVSITTQPTTPVAATVGSACSITGLVAAGTSPTYQWYTCNSDGSGATAITSAGAMSFTGYTSATLGLTPTAAGATYYKCVVSGSCGDPVTSSVVTVNASAAPASALITYNLNVGTSASTTIKSSTSTTDGTNITNIDIDQTNDGANGAGASDRTTKLALATGTTASAVAEPDKYEVFTFKVACGKKVTPSEVKIKVANVGGSAGGNQNYKAVLSDTYGHSISNTFTGTKSDGSVEEFSITNGSSVYFQGVVTLKLWSCKGSGGNASAFRMGTPLEIYGEVGNQATPAATITWNTQPANGQVGDPDFAYDVTCSDGSTVTVTSANTTYATIVGGKLHYAAAGTTHLVATATDACGNVVVQNSSNFTVSAAAPIYSVTHSLTNVTATSGATGAGAATEGVAYNAVFAANTGYVLPSTITVTIGGSSATVGTGYTWNSSTGAFQVPAAQVTGAIVITIAGETAPATKDIYYGHVKITDGALVREIPSGATQFFTNIGGTVANNTEISLTSTPSTGGIYYNSNNLTDAELSKSSNWGTSSGSNRYVRGLKFANGTTYTLALGTKVASVITFYGWCGSESRTMTIGGEEYTSSATKNTFAKHEFIKTGGFTGNVSITQDGDFYGILVITIQTATPCTTPVIPALSNQSLCEGTDIAAWNATVTNAAAISTAGETVAYSWKKKGNDTELANTATFDLGSSATESQAGTYVVTVTVSKTGYASSTATKEVTLSVTDGIEVTGITADKATVYPTNSVTLTATASATATWQWYTCNNAEGAGAAIISGAESASYTITSADVAGTYYYKAVATGSCGTGSMVYTLTVSAAAGGDCGTEFWFAKAADKPESATAATHITGTPSGSSSATYTATIDGNSYPITGSTGQKTGNVTITVPEDNEGTLYVVVAGSSNRTITLSKGVEQVGQETPANSTWGTFTFDGLDAGTYTLVSSGNISWGIIALKLCSGEACTDPEVTASVNNSTACVGSSVTFTATGAHASATYRWQKYSGGAWTDIANATAATYTIPSVATTDALKYRVIARNDCDRTSNEVTLSVPVAPVFGSFTATRSVMATQALSITDVEASDATSYAWYKSADATYDAGTDTKVGTTQELLLASGGETAGTTYYLFCVASNACGSTTSSAITVNVTAFVEEDCATRGTEGAAEFGFQNSGCGQGTYNSASCWTMNSNSKILIYSAPDGKYFKTMKVTIASSSASKASYNWSTDGGTTYTSNGVAITGVTTTLTEKTIDLSAHGNVNEVKIGRNFGNGESSGTLYVSKICFEYTSACTATTVTPSTSSKTYEMDGSTFTEPTFTVKHGGTAFDPQPTLSYSSSNEDIASVDDDGTVTFNGEAGTVTITASYAGGTISATEYCASSGSYTITVSCPGGAPKVVADGSVDMSGCNSSVTLLAKTQADGDFADGTYQWFRNGEEIDGATSSSYTATQAGTYTVERTNGTGCTTPSTNSAVVTSETTEPEVERLVPFQYYHVDKTYSDQMKMRHLFAVKNSGKLDGKSFKMYVSRNGGAATDVTNSAALEVWSSADGRVDTVMVNLNELSGKYSANDELVFTCKAIDCTPAVSDVYKNTITMRVIGATPTLALICSGSSKAEGTRKTSELTVGGDFLTGYNVADLCQQTGNTSFNANIEWGLYTDLKTQYIVTPVNGYAVFNRLNYEPFDILLLTDYPKASKSDAAADVLDDMAALCDYRPMLSFKTHMVAKSPSKWAAKGFTTSPVVSKADGRLNLNIVCYAHPMFASLKTGENVYTDVANTSAPLVYTMLTGEGYEGKKGMQGFELAAAENFVTIGLTHYNATIAKDSPSEGQVSWTPGTEDRMLVTVAERQANPEARFILFSLNIGAHSKLTDKGEQVVLACLNYLLGTAEGTIEPADCSFTFDNGENNEHDDAWYANPSNCAECTGTKGDGKWTTAANWGPDYRLLPGEFTSVRIKKPVEVNDEHAHVMEVRLIDEGSIDIPAGKGLDVKSTIRRQDGSEIYPTEENDIHIGSASTGNGTLIFNNNDGDTKARVDMYSKASIIDGVKNYQYMGVPCVNINAAYNYYGSWIYSWSDKGDSYGWQKVVNGGIVTTWTGYCITQESAGTYYAISGTLAATGTVDIPVPAGENMVVGNSWTAPISIGAFADDDFENLLGNVYFFNAGVDKDYTSGHTETADKYAPSTYVTVPIHAADYTGTSDHIPSLQGFFVKNTSGSDGVLHLDYDRHVRGTTRDNILSGPMHAPRRANAQSDEPAVLKIKVSGENYDDKLLLLAREDFTTGFDNGWDGDKWDGNESALYIYTKDEEGTENSVSALPEMEGTVIGFRAGEDDAYTLHFEYLNSAEELYLFDTETNAYTKIMTGATYRFFTEDKEKHERFIITRKSPQIATDVDEVDSGKRREVRKLLIEDKMYILVNGMLYDATGKVVK